MSAVTSDTLPVESSWDLFLSYSRADTDLVLAVRALLEARGISTFFDREQLLAGMPWPQALEQGLRGVRGVAVFIGPSGLGLWQKREMAFALDRQVAEERNQHSFPVIPVLLPGADVTPGFLFLNTWIDLRPDPTDPDGLDILSKAARGEASGDGFEDASGLCPYQGLMPFREESAAFFCGREAFALRIKETLLRRGLVVVIGPSGSGKSSLIQAGVLPLLRRQRPPDATWDAVTCIPGHRPFYHLAAALVPLLLPELRETELLAEANRLEAMLKQGQTLLTDVVDRILARSCGTDRLLLVADQFEEVFTLCDEEDRKLFLGTLFYDGEGSGRLTIVITMRGTFYEHLIAADRHISDRLENAIVNLGPMSREELQKAIVDPAKRLGLRFEPGLAKRMLDDVGDEPGNLPLLEFALTELWVRRDGRLLTHSAYEQIGGVAGAIVQRAEAVFTSFSAPEQSAVKEVLMRLVWVRLSGDDGLEARRRIHLSDLDEEARQHIQVMADARLLVIGQERVDGDYTVEVAHEALIRKWPRMREWLAENQEFLLWLRRLQGAKEIWQHNREDEASLLHGNPLHEAKRWLNTCHVSLGMDDKAYIQASLEVNRRNNVSLFRRRRRILACSIGLALIFMCLTVLAVWQSMSALSEKLAAMATSYLRTDPEQSVLLGIEAVKAQPTDEVADVLKLALQNSLLVTLEDKLDYLTQVFFSPHGDIIVATGKDRRPRVWNWDGHYLSNPRVPKKLPEPINGLALNPNWTIVVATNADHSADLLDIASGRVLGKLIGHKGQLVSAAFSPDGAFVLTASEDGSARLWDAHNFQSLLVLKRHTGRLTDAAFSPDGKQIVTASLDGSAIVWDAASGQDLFQLLGHQSTVTSARFSPDGKRIVTASADNTALVWDAQTGKPMRHLEGHVDPLSFASFSPVDPDLILTISLDRTAKVWKSPSRNHFDWHVVNELHGHKDILTGAAFSPDGRYIATVSRDRSIRLWRTLTEHGRLALFGHNGSVHDAVFSPGGSQVVSASSDNTARIWDLANPHKPLILEGHQDSLCCAVYSSDGGLIITGSDDHQANIWDAASGKLLTTLSGHQDGLNSVAFDAGGNRALTASDDNTARIWEVATGKTLHVLDGNSANATKAYPIARQGPVISDDGSRVANLEGERIRVRQVSTGDVLADLDPHEGKASAQAFSVRGERLATADSQGWVRVWNTQDWQMITEFKAHDGEVSAAVFNGDGLWLATAGIDHALRLWGTDTGTPKGNPFIHAAPLADARFSADGKTLIGITVQREINTWNLETGKSTGSVCPDCVSLGGHAKRVLTAVFSPDEREVLTASRDGRAMLWDAATGWPIGVLNHQAALVGAQFSPDGSFVLTLGRDAMAKLWHREGKGFAPPLVLAGHQDELTSGGFSLDGSQIVTASRDGTARLWDTSTGRLLKIFKAHHDWINSVAFSPDGTLLLTASADGIAIVWDIQNGTMKLELRGHGQGLEHARFNEDGTQVVTASRDNTLRVWNLKDIEENKTCPECQGSIEAICKQARQRTRHEFSDEEQKNYHLPWFSRLLNWRCE